MEGFLKKKRHFPHAGGELPNTLLKSSKRLADTEDKGQTMSRPFEEDMSRNDTIDENALWALLINLQKAAETTFSRAVKARKNTSFGPLSASLRRMHWAAAFLALTDLADICAAGAAFVYQLQDGRSPWSNELTAAVKTLLKRTRAFIEARASEPAAGVFIDSHDAVLQGPQLLRPVPTDDLKSLFRRRQIDINRVSATHHLTVSQDEAFSHAITVPSFAKQRHKPDKHLTLVYLDLEEQEESLTELVEIFEAAFESSQILLHGPLGIPWSKYRNYTENRPYYILLDTVDEAQEWLRSAGLKGRVVKVLKTPEKESSSDEPKVIIREIPVQHAAPAPVRTSTGFSAEIIEPGEPGSLEPLSGRAGRRPPRKKKKIKNRDLNIRFPVGAKLILIVSIIIIVAMTTLTYLALFFFQKETENRVRDTNLSLSRIVAQQAEKEIVQLFDSANLLFQIGGAAGGSVSLVGDFFDNSQSLIYVGIPNSDMNFSNRDWFRANRIFNESAVLQDIFTERSEDLEKAKAGETVVINVSPLISNLETPVIALAAPFLLGDTQEALIVLADVGDTLAESVRIQEGFTTTVIINSEGEILAHPDYTRIFGGETLRDSAVFQEMYGKGLPEGQLVFREDTAEGSKEVIGSFSLISVGNLGVVTTVLKDDAFSVVDYIQKLNIYMLGAILSLAILAVYFFSFRISNPLKELTLATRMIKAGNWNIAVKPRSSDEVGQLTRNFMSMIPSLEARDRLKQKTETFINRQVAAMIDEDKLPDHAETKNVTVFFSDVRGFTAMSEAMGDPQIVLDNLSEYFKAMVPCVEETGGTVDKFIGDAVMAVWGSMQDLPNNAESAVNGALKMRSALKEFNFSRGTPNRPIFHIGCGLNSGPATVGLMGDQTTKMEWAHMGDTVNLASRIEALNKPMGTDILISQGTADLVEGIYDLVPMNKIKVKGKGRPQQIYAVLGRMDDDFRPRSLAEMRAMVGITGDFGNMSITEEHEVKYEILDS